MDVPVTIDDAVGASTMHRPAAPRRAHPDAASSWCCSTSATATAADRESRCQLTSPTETAARELDDELAAPSAQLRSTIEQYETQVEEAKASNEELQAINEELRSAAEELETEQGGAAVGQRGADHGQSGAEDQDRGAERSQQRLPEPDQLHRHRHHLPRPSLRVKLSSPRARDVFNLLPTDIGRPLSDITSRLHDDRPASPTSASCSNRLQTVEREVADRRRPLVHVARSCRIAPSTTASTASSSRSSTSPRAGPPRAQVRASEERLRLLIDSAIDYAIFTIDRRGHHRFVERRRRADVRLPRRGERSGSDFACCSRRRTGPPACPAEELERGPSQRPRRRRALAPAQGRRAVLLQRRHHRVSAAAGSASRRSRAT